MSGLKEDKLIRFCSRINMDGHIKQRAKEAIQRDLNWDYILEETRKSGVSSLLYRNLKEIDEDGLVPRELAKKLEDIYFDTTVKNIVLLGELGKVLKKFKDEKVSAIVLKGAALLENIYQNIGLRAMNDIDLLIKKEQFPQIDNCLRQLGYTSPYHWSDYMAIPPGEYLNSLYYERREDKIPVFLHLHWHIINSVVPACSYGTIDIEKFWKEARQVPIAGVKSWVMAPSHLLIHLSEHIFKHSYDRFILFCDILELINYYDKDGLDWELLIEDTVEFNLNKPVYYGLYFTSKFWEAKIPAGVLARLKPSPLNDEEKKIQVLIEKKRKLPELEYFSYFIINEKLTEKLKFILGSIFPPREVLALQYKTSPQDIRFYHYLPKLKNAFLKGLGAFTHLGRRPF